MAGTRKRTRSRRQLLRLYRHMHGCTSRHDTCSPCCRNIGSHKLATADAIIYATAEHHDADILTCDAHFKDLDRVIYIDKARVIRHVTQRDRRTGGG